MPATSTHRRVRDGSRSAELRVLFTVEEAAHALGIGRTRMFALIHGGHVETVQIGRLRRVPVDALHTFVSGLRESPEPPAQ